MKPNPAKNPGGRSPIDGEAATAWIQLRTTMARKRAYVRAARPGKLTAWIFRHLDTAAQYNPTPPEAPGQTKR